MASFGYSAEAVGAARATRATAVSACPDVALILLIIRCASLCDTCISRQTGIAEKDIAPVLSHMIGTIEVRADFGRCDGCMRPDLLSRLG